MFFVRWLAPAGPGPFLSERVPVDAVVGGSIVLLLLSLVFVGVLARTLLEDWIS